VAGHFDILYAQKCKSSCTQKSNHRQITYFCEANINRFNN